MKTNNQQDQNKKHTSLKRINYRLLIYIGIMICLNFLVSDLTKTGHARHLNGQIASLAEIRQSTIRTLVFGFTVFGFITGSILSFIPYKQLKYGEKYIFFSLLSILGFHLIAFLLGIRNLIMF